MAMSEPCETIKLESDVKNTAFLNVAKDLFDDYIMLNGRIAHDIVMTVHEMKDVGLLADYIADNIIRSYEKKQVILETFDETERMEKVIEMFRYENEVMSIEEDIAEKTKEGLDNNQKEYYLREKLRVIREELGDSEDMTEEMFEYHEKISALKTTDENKEQQDGRRDEAPVIAERESCHNCYALAALEIHIEGIVMSQDNAGKSPGLQQIDCLRVGFSEQKTHEQQSQKEELALHRGWLFVDDFFRFLTHLHDVDALGEVPQVVGAALVGAELLLALHVEERHCLAGLQVGPQHAVAEAHLLLALGHRLDGRRLAGEEHLLQRCQGQRLRGPIG